MDRSLPESPRKDNRKDSITEEIANANQQDEKQGAFKIGKSIKKFAKKGIEKVNMMFVKDNKSDKDWDASAKNNSELKKERDSKSPTFRDSEGSLDRHSSADRPPLININEHFGGDDIDNYGIKKLLPPFCVPQRPSLGSTTEHHEFTSPAGALPVYHGSRLSPTVQILSRFLGGQPDSPLGATLPGFLTGIFSGGIKSGLDPDYAGYDAPPYIVWELLEHFFPSKLHRLLVIDMVSLGCYDEVHIDVHGVHHGRDRNNSSPRTRDRYSVSKSRGRVTSISSSRSRHSSNRNQPEDANYTGSSSTKSVWTGARSDGSSFKSAPAYSDTRMTLTADSMDYQTNHSDDVPNSTSHLPTATTVGELTKSGVVGKDGDGLADNADTDIDSLWDETSIAEGNEEDYDDEDEDISDLDIGPGEYTESIDSTDIGNGKDDATSSPLSPWKTQKVYQYLLPQPHEMYALMMPSRSYHHHNIEIMCRVVERMVADTDSSRIWSLAFKNCLFATDFHETFLAALRRTPQIVALLFAADASSAHLVNTKKMLAHWVI